MQQERRISVSQIYQERKGGSLIYGPIYHIKCEGDQNTKCNKDYIGETERTLKSVIHGTSST